MWILSKSGRVTPQAIKEFNAQSPRTTAIVGAAILEDCLGLLIGMRFPVEGETKAQLFKATGPLGNLDTKIKVAYAMGIVSKAAYQDLRKIVEVRNKFAHRLEITDFGHPEVRSLCAELKLIEAHIFPAGTTREHHPDAPSHMIFVDGLKERLADPRGRYFLSVMLLHGISVNVPHPDDLKPPLPRPLI